MQNSCGVRAEHHVVAKHRLGDFDNRRMLHEPLEYLAMREQPANVFERFYRGTPPGSGDTAPRTEGSGLGLAIVKTIAEAHGGAATVTSRAGQGSRFEITLPLG